MFELRNKKRAIFDGNSKQRKSRTDPNILQLFLPIKEAGYSQFIENQSFVKEWIIFLLENHLSFFRWDVRELCAQRQH